MITIRNAIMSDAAGIREVCIKGNQDAYASIYSGDYLQTVIDEFYNLDRIKKEIIPSGRGWSGYLTALQHDRVVGAIGGGMIGEKAGEIYVLYLDPDYRGRGIGTKLLEALTKQQKELYGAEEQWVSVQKGNEKGIPFYEARGFVFQKEQPGYGESKEAASYISLRYKRRLRS
ncbi:GNAT family N-acetyltransferase [Halobacillus halophilus]|uniref:GNAT family N-acetyltransferase n=1 Tax=Halobacillus halophilus TaxID=1570 RepID=UPI00136E8A74|nr:N-acetyltransferase [Halobacillus halophilus]MYL30377.1 GNAT family N-acetyltransferase [Halobacillus halophilus]